MATITCDFDNDPICRLRFKVGDNETSPILPDALYQYLLDTNDNDENVVSIESLKYLVTTTAKYVDEEAGDESAKWSQMHRQFKSLLDAFINDPSLSIIASPTPYAGGISNSDIESNDNNSDNRRPAIRQGVTTSVTYIDPTSWRI